MSKNLQKSGHRERDYNRPTKKWLCGHSKDGKECPLGPSARGDCRGTGECLPTLKNDRWHCSRPDSAGGECGSGPSPDGQCGCKLTTCQPARSLREVRRLVSIGVALLMIGIILVTLSFPPRNPNFIAGQLTTAHAGEMMECGNCHTEASLLNLKSAANPHSLHNRALKNSQLCIDCHKTEIGSWEESARFSHGWNPEHLELKTAAAKEPDQKFAGKAEVALWIASQGPLREKGATGQLACATCHKEHEGPDHSLTTLSNKQCQVCHEKQFHSFDLDHPTFAASNYPYSRRTRIFFDHGNHYEKHFATKPEGTVKGFDKEQPFAKGESCNNCHQSDETGGFMRLQGFEASCGSCHETYVKGGDTLTLLALPEIDPDASKGKWPASGLGLIPPMRLLLSDKDARPAANLFKEEEEGAAILMNNQSSPEDVKKAHELIAKDLEILFKEAWDNEKGPLALEARLEANGFKGAENNVALFEGLSIDTFRRFLFTDEESLSGGILDKSPPKNQPPPAASEPLKSQPTPPASSNKADDDFGAPAKKPAKADDDFGAPAKQPAKADDDFGTPAKQPAKADDDFGAPAKKPAKADDDFGAPAKKPAKADDDFGAPAKKPAKADDDFGGPAKKPAKGDDDFGNAPKNQEQDDSAVPVTLFEPNNLTDWQTAGGWFYENNAIHYRSQGHADPLIKAWIEAAVLTINTKDERARKDARRLLDYSLGWKDGVNSKASGKCFTCHSIDRDPVSKQYSINWFGVYGSPKVTNLSSDLTHFSHAKHLVALDCISCHAFKETADYADFFPKSDGPELSDPHKYSSNFQPLNEKTNCASCHQKSRAGNKCLQCHGYHSYATRHKGKKSSKQ